MSVLKHFGLCECRPKSESCFYQRGNRPAAPGSLLSNARSTLLAGRAVCRRTEENKRQREPVGIKLKFSRLGEDGSPVLLKISAIRSTSTTASASSAHQPVIV